MARKRGGLAGIWDRNKNIITPVATGLVGAFGSPLAAAALGATMRGLDRPGKSGIGLDPFAAMRGGVEGYATGSLGASAKKGIASLLAPKMPELPPIDMASKIGITPDVPASSMSLPPVDMTSKIGMTPGITSAAPKPVTTVARGMGTPAPTPGNPSRVSRLLSGAKDNWEMISDAGKGLNAMLGMQGQEDMARQKLEQDRRDFEQRMAEFNFRRTETEAERESRRRLTQLLMPLFQAQMTNVLPPNPAVTR
jgi:hypothetical protein